MKMSDAEIIKAFTICANQGACKDCPLDDLGGVERCMHTLLLNALDLINRLKAENDDLKRDAIPKLQKSLDRANKYGDETEKENERLKAEIERLKSKVNRLKQYDEERDIRLHARLIATAKSEAYKEFAERLMQRKYQSSDWSHGEHPFVVEENDIIDVLEEMGCDNARDFIQR